MKIAICGSAPSSAHLAPFADKSSVTFAQGKVPTNPSPHVDEEWEIWGCSPGLYGLAPRANRWFEVHRWEPGQAWFSPEYVQFLKNFKGPVYTGAPVPEIPNHVVYPIDAVEDEFSAFFLTSSLALMQALAIQTIEQIRKARRTGNPADLPRGILGNELLKEDDDDVIGLWGVDMSATEEYARQRPGCWFFCLQILERGIGLYYPPESDLMVPEPVYGLCEWDHEYIKATARARELGQRHAMAQQKLQEASNEMNMIGGARDNLNYMITNWMGHKYKLPAGQVLRRKPK